MRKKLLLFEIEKLVKKNSEYYNDNLALSRTVEELKLEIENLNNKISELEAKRIAEINCINENDNNDNYVLKDNFDIVYNESIQTDNVVETYNDEIILPDEINNAASIIGSVVLKCAEYCNKFTSDGGINAKDLVNLALGRTEVFKSEVLQIISSDETNDTKNRMINEGKDAVYDYFELLLKQI